MTAADCLPFFLVFVAVVFAALELVFSAARFNGATGGVLVADGRSAAGALATIPVLTWACGRAVHIPLSRMPTLAIIRLERIIYRPMRLITILL